MLQEPMMEKLLAMRLHGMADALKMQQQDPAAGELSFLDRLALLIDQQWHWRQNQALARRLQTAKLRGNPHEWGLIMNWDEWLEQVAELPALHPAWDTTDASVSALVNIAAIKQIAVGILCDSGRHSHAMSREIIAQFAGVRRRIPDLDQLVVRWILKRGRDFDVLTIIHLENRQLSRAGDRPFVAEYLFVPENAHVEFASLVEVIRLHDEIRDIADRRPRRGGGRQRHDS